MTPATTFQALLRLRRRHEDAARQAFAAAKAEVEAIDRRLARLRLAMSLHNEAARGALAAGRSADLTRYRRSVEDLPAAIAEHSRRRRSAEDALGARREELVEAMKQRQAAASMLERADIESARERRGREEREQDDVHSAHVAAVMER